MERMSYTEKEQYIGFWFAYDDSFLLETGDVVMYETLEGIEVATIDSVGYSGDKYSHRTEEKEYWHFNGYIIPRRQIIAYKPKQ